MYKKKKKKLQNESILQCKISQNEKKEKTLKLVSHNALEHLHT
jgi:hypothetical protein